MHFQSENNRFLEEIIGPGYKCYPLKPLISRVLQTLRRSPHHSPRVTLITQACGNKYKLLTVDVQNKKKLDRIRKNLPLLERLDFVPKIVFSDDMHLLAEYIDGRPPDISNGEFASAFGRNLAAVHNIGVGYIKEKDFIANLEDDLRYLMERGILSMGDSKRIFHAITRLRPEVIRTSMIYTDMRCYNFVLDRDNRLFFTDLGSFNHDRITGQFVVGRRMYNSINKGLFREAYQSSGGSEFIFKNELFLSALFLLDRAAHWLKVSEQRPFYEWRPKKLRLYYVRFGIPRLMKMISG